MTTEKPLVDDLADVLSHMVVGWEPVIGHDLAEHPEVVRVMERYRESSSRDYDPRYYRSVLQWIRQTATVHYIGDAFEPEHMRQIANFAIAALRGDPITDFDEASERAQTEARRLMELFSEDE